MANHVHVLLAVEGDPDPENILRDLKSYGSRALSRTFERPISSTWWTKSGSKRRVKEEENVVAVHKYILEQENPLALWVAKDVN
jgi:REP element-mobilizing transposase RayT